MPICSIDAKTINYFGFLNLTNGENVIKMHVSCCIFDQRKKWLQNLTLYILFILRIHDPHILISQFSIDPSHISLSNKSNAYGNAGRDRHIFGPNAFSEKFLFASPVSYKCFGGCQSFCLQSGEKKGNCKLKLAFPNQEFHGADETGIDLDNENKREVASGELFESNSDDDSIGIADYSLDISDTAVASHGGDGKSSTSPLFRILMEAPHSSISNVLEKWVEDGNILDRGEVSVAILKLQKLRLYGKALQFVEWLEATKHLNFVEHDYAAHLDLVAKVHGLQQAETYINEIPESLRGEVIYRTFLASCVSALNVKKAEEVFKTMRDFDLPISTFSCDQLLLLYKTVDKKKVSYILTMMEKESIRPSIFTYRLLIQLKGGSHDIAGMEQIVEKMKADGMEPDLIIQAMVVKYYIFGGFNEKAEAALKGMEGDDIKENRNACRFLLRLYASLNKADDVERVWNVCKADPRLDDCLAAIEAWGKVGNVEKAEEAFKINLKLREKVSSKIYVALLMVYANNKLLFEGEELVNLMKENGHKIGPSTCDALVKLYVEAGEVEKAECFLLREAEKEKIRVPCRSLITLLKEYSKRGDIHNAEKIFHKLRQIGYKNELKAYRSRMKLHQLLLEAYLNAESPAYGFRERMKAENIFPNKQLAGQLAAIDALRKAQVGELAELDAELRFIFFKTK